MTTVEKVRVGGFPVGYPAQHWPHYDGKALTLLASCRHQGSMVYSFLDFCGGTEVGEHSWEPTGSANAIIYVDDQGVSAPEWVELKPVNLPDTAALSEIVPAPVQVGEPDWIQGDETPEGFEFLFQVRSEQGLNIGGAHGDAYIFGDAQAKVGRMVWQA